jgi:hypothetical protein
MCIVTDHSSAVRRSAIMNVHGSSQCLVEIRDQVVVMPFASLSGPDWSVKVVPLRAREVRGRWPL